MKLYFGGGEISTFRKILAESGDLPISISYLSLVKNEKKLPEYRGPILLDSGSMSLQKTESDFEEVYELAAQYMNFIKANIGDVDLVAEFDSPKLTLPVIKQLRSEFYNTLPEEKFMPVWHPEYDKAELEELCSSYPIVGVTQEDIHGDTSNVPLFNQMIQRYGVKLHGAGITSKKLVEAVKWTSVSSTAWLSTTRYGELFVWTGREFKRYPKSYKERAAKTHRALFDANGFDYEAIERGDSTELLRLSAWSWQNYIDSIAGVTTKRTNPNSDLVEEMMFEVDNQRNPVRTGLQLNTRQTTLIPVAFQSVEKEEAEDGDYDFKPVLNIRSESMRICDTCFLRDKCPGFEPNSTCLYNIPIEIKTKTQLKNLQNSLVEMQSQRVLFMKMAEDLSGGYADPNLSSEIDRLQRMIKTVDEAGTDKFSMSVTMSQSEPKPRFMERFLGAAVSSKIQELEAPIDADALILDSEIGELVA